MRTLKRLVCWLRGHQGSRFYGDHTCGCSYSFKVCQKCQELYDVQMSTCEGHHVL